MAEASAPSEDGEAPDLDGVDPADIDELTEEPAAVVRQIETAAARLSLERVQTIVESLLLVADRPITLVQLNEVTGIPPQTLESALLKLQGVRREGVSGVVLVEVAGGWQFRTDPGNAEYVRRFLKVKPQRLTRAALETLAIIAYRQPVTRPEIEDIRGVDSGAVVKALLDRRLVKILGKKEEVGRPILYGTTREFLEFFALKDLAALPTLRDFHELSKEHEEIVERETAAALSAPPPVSLESLRERGADTQAAARVRASDEAMRDLEVALTQADVTDRAAREALKEQQPEAPTAN